MALRKHHLTAVTDTEASVRAFGYTPVHMLCGVEMSEKNMSVMHQLSVLHSRAFTTKALSLATAEQGLSVLHVACLGGKCTEALLRLLVQLDTSQLKSVTTLCGPLALRCITSDDLDELLYGDLDEADRSAKAIYDRIYRPQPLNAAIFDAVERLTEPHHEKSVLLDAGCGTGIACVSLAKMNVKNVVGVDKSNAMIQQAKTKTLPQTTLTDPQKETIEWRTADLIDPSSSAGGEYTHAMLLYFTIYYFTDKETIFRNLFFWVKPGGKLVVHVVNKHKFDPMLESSSPWLGFSLQKYSKERITRSEVVFNKFKYVGEFDLHDPAAEFRETIRFNNKMVRRQRHMFRMEDMKEIVGMATAAGWEYVGNVDLTPISFEYAFHLHFKHP
jgi:2-polyprenyl-3-methyl-5-hydroxy-6-metoxy-1,4-benzoquinol methylase